MKPKVLCVTSNFPRWNGDSTTPFVLNLAKDLQALDWQVDVLAPHAPNVSKRDNLDGISVKRFQYLWPASLQSLCYHGGALVNLRLRRHLWAQVPLLVAAEFAAISRELLLNRYDIIHAHWILPQGIAAMVPAAVAGIPMVITIHGSDILSLQGRHLAWWKRLALSRANAVTVNSSYTAEAMQRLAPNDVVGETIPMGVDTQPPRAELSAQLRQQYRRGAGPLLVFVGRMVFEKGVDDLLQAVSLLKRHHPQLRCLIIGEGQEKADYQALSSKLGLEQQVEFLGWVQPQDISSYIAAADCFVGPSKRARDGCMEAQGLTFIEAMVAGTPVVATRSGGIVDSVRHEETGLLVAESSPQEIAAAVGRVIDDPALAESLVARARTCATAEFSRQQSAKRFSELFERCLSRPNV